MSATIRVTNVRLHNVSKGDIVTFPGGEFPGWWQVMRTKPAATNFLCVTLAQPLLEGGWLKRTTLALPYWDLVQIQTFEKVGSGVGLAAIGRAADMSGTGDGKHLRRRWVRLDGVLPLPLPLTASGDGTVRYGVALEAAGPTCPYEEGRETCWWAAIFGGPDMPAAEIGPWVDLLRDWHHTSEKSARLAIEDEFFADSNEWKKSAALR